MIVGSEDYDSFTVSFTSTLLRIFVLLVYLRHSGWLRRWEKTSENIRVKEALHKSIQKSAIQKPVYVCAWVFGA